MLRPIDLYNNPNGNAGLVRDPVQDHYQRTRDARRMQAEVIVMAKRWISARLRRLFKRIMGHTPRSAMSVNGKQIALLHSGLADESRFGDRRLTGAIRRFIVEPQARRRRRRDTIERLRSLDDRLLADIGLTRWQIELAVDGKLSRRAEGYERPDHRVQSSEEEFRLAA